MTDNWDNDFPFGETDFPEDIPFQDPDIREKASAKKTSEAESQGDSMPAGGTDVGAADAGGEQDAEGMTLEDAFRRLDELAAQLEKRDIPLEESFRLYKEGMDLLKFCRDRIDTVEKKMQIINDDGELQDFE